MKDIEMSIGYISGYENGNWICFADNYKIGWYAEDFNEKRNVELFCIGLREIMRMKGEVDKC